jgi:hypothetical protein
MRVESQQEVKTGGWIHKRNGAVAQQVTLPIRETTRRTDLEMDTLWRPRAKQWRDQGRGELGRLAAVLGVSVMSLQALRVGWDGKAWTFPERNGAGLVVGVSRRFEDGAKRCAKGSHRGLTYCQGWGIPNGPVFIVEGGSDVAAGLTLLLAVVGRPSNLGGINMLTELLRGKDRQIIVIGERDRKTHDSLPEITRKTHNPKCGGCPKCWPGCYGSRRAAARLSNSLGRKVVSTLPPNDAKDLRGWLNRRSIDVESEAAVQALRAEFLDRVG